MNIFKKALNLILLFTIVCQVTMPAFAAQDQSKIEKMRENHFFKKFDRKFDRFASDVDDMLVEYSDQEINEMYEDMIVWLEQHGNYEMAQVMMAQHGKGKGSVKEILFRMASEESREEAKAALRIEIAKAGGFDAFIKLSKAHRRQNVDVKCRVKKIGSIALIAPVTFIGMVTGLTAITAAVAGTFTLVVAAYAGTFILADGIAFPWFINNIDVGCYNETKHPDFTNMN